MNDSTLFLAAWGSAALLIGAFLVLVLWIVARETRLQGELSARRRPASALRRRWSHARRR